MSQRGICALVILGTLISCGPGQPETDDTVAVPTTVGPASTRTTASQGDLVEAYLVEMVNLTADLRGREDNLVSAQVDDPEFTPCEDPSLPCDSPLEPPPEPTEAQLVEFMERNRDLMVDTLGLSVEHADLLERVVPPPGFEAAHRDYVQALRAFSLQMRDRVAEIDTVPDFEEFVGLLNDPLAGLPTPMNQLNRDLVDACQVLVDLGVEAGFRMDGVDLGCPSPPPTTESVRVEVGDVWVATPDPVPSADVVSVVIVNNGTEPIQPIAVHLSGLEVFDLPVVDGRVDLSRSGEGLAFFIAWNGQEEVLSGREPPELASGETLEVLVWATTEIVVFDYRQGRFEAGDYVIIERTPPGS